MNIEELIVRLRIEEVNNGSKEMFYYVCGYYNCDKIGHNKNHKTNVGDIVIWCVQDNLMVSKVNLIRSSQESGRLTIGAIWHAYSDKEMFTFSKPSRETTRKNLLFLEDILKSA